MQVKQSYSKGEVYTHICDIFIKAVRKDSYVHIILHHFNAVRENTYMYVFSVGDANTFHINNRANNPFVHPTIEKSAACDVGDHTVQFSLLSWLAVVF